MTTPDDTHAAFDNAYQTEEEQAYALLQGVPPPPPRPPPPPPVPVTIASTTVTPAPPAPAGPSLGDRLADAARGFGGAVSDFVKGRLAAAQEARSAPPAPIAPAVAVAAPARPWLPWAVLAGVLLLIVALARR